MDLKDKTARQTALDIERSLAVSAPAGSGKTSLLVQRILRLLARSDKPEEILAITFTRKAANEMRNRILKALRDAASDEPISGMHQQALRDDAKAALQRDRDCGWNLLQNPVRLRLQTFDSFCHYLARRLTLETGTAIPSSIADIPQPLYREAVDNLLQFSGSDNIIGRALQQLSDHFDADWDALVDQLAVLLDSRQSWLDIILDPDFGAATLQANLNHLIETDLQLLHTQLANEKLCTELEALFAYAADNLAIALEHSRLPLSQEDAATAEYLPAWQKMIAMILTNEGTLRKKPNKTNGFPSPKDGGDAGAIPRIVAVIEQLADNAPLLSQLARVRALPDQSNNPASSEQMLEALASLMPALAAQLNLLFAERDTTDYAGISIRALQALGTAEEPTSLTLRLDYQIRHLLVDEFQDTSSLQVELLCRLCAGWQAGDGRTLFVVGDAMQSIYEFRRANVGLFIRAREQGIGHIPLEAVDLSTNFRSRAGIVDWVNRQFPSIFPEKDDRIRGQVRYRRSAANDDGKIAADIELHTYIDRISEAEAIAASIQAHLNRESERIAILVRKRSDLPEILRALTQSGIAYRTRDVLRLHQRMHVRDVHSLVRALHSPADRVAWLSLLRSPMAGLDMQDLWLLCGAEQSDHKKACLWTRINGFEEITGLSEAGRQILAKVRTQMSRMFALFGTCGLRGLVQDAWQALGGDRCLLQPSYLQDIEDYLNLIDQQENGGLLGDLERFEEALQKLYSRPKADSAASVEVMTIYAAKGLEFDRVYLPALNGTTGSGQSKPVLVWQEREYLDNQRHFLAAIKAAKGEDDAVYNFLYDEEKERKQDELARLLYVASTRAIKGLYLSGCLKWNEQKSEWRSPPSGSLLALLWPNLQSEFSLPAIPAAEQDEDHQPQRVLSGIRRLRPEQPESLVDADESIPEEPAQSLADGMASNLLQRAVGTLLHEALMWQVQSPEYLTDGHKIESYWRNQLRAQGFAGESLESGILQIRAALQKAVTSELGLWVLNADHAESACELEMLQPCADGSLRRLIIDRTFVDQNSRWIIDYKSAVPLTNESEANFLARQSEKYRSQLQSYRGLFAPLPPVRTLLYFPACHLHCEITH